MVLAGISSGGANSEGKASVATLQSWLREPPHRSSSSTADPSQWKRRKHAEGMHGVSVSDHGEKTMWSGYWEDRQRKLQTQTVNGGLYAAVTSRLAPKPSGATLASKVSTGAVCAAAPKVFKQCRIWFDGRVDLADGLCCYSLGKLARLHGAEVLPRLTKRGVTHVVCTQLSGAKERVALADEASRGVTTPYFVRPEWITQSIAACKRQSERRFSVLAAVAQDAGITLLQTKQTPNSPGFAHDADACSSQVATAASPCRTFSYTNATETSEVFNSVITVEASQPEDYRNVSCAKTPATVHDAEIYVAATPLDAGSEDEAVRTEKMCTSDREGDLDAAMTELDSEEEPEEIAEVVSDG